MTELDPRVFRRAAELVREGWGRRTLYMQSGRTYPATYCAIGALYRAQFPRLTDDEMWAATLTDDVYVNANHSPYAQMLADVIGRHGTATTCGVIYAFNDARDRTSCDVVRVLETCAEKLEAEVDR